VGSNGFGWLKISTLIGLALAVGCSHPAYGPEGEDRLEQAVREGKSSTPDTSAPVKLEDVEAKRCTNYHEALQKAHSEDVKEEDRLDAYMNLYKSLKDRSDFIDNALARNPDLGFQNDNEIGKMQSECVQALADVHADYYAFLSDISDMLVVQDVHGVPVPRLDFNKYKDAVTVLNPDDKDALLGRIDTAKAKIKAGPAATASP
jgi:hypothetical protein